MELPHSGSPATRNWAPYNEAGKIRVLMSFKGLVHLGTNSLWILLLTFSRTGVAVPPTSKTPVYYQQGLADDSEKEFC